ncbi:MAG: hypothetical protein ACXADB_13070 [Candidatus Hermodarchaeia archaeon]|jgi:hypothetical protein
MMPVKIKEMTESDVDIDHWLKMLANRMYLRSDFRLVMPEVYTVKRALTLAQVAELVDAQR